MQFGIFVQYVISSDALIELWSNHLSLDSNQSYVSLPANLVINSLILENK